jgi:hypothetical protein
VGIDVCLEFSVVCEWEEQRRDGTKAFGKANIGRWIAIEIKPSVGDEYPLSFAGAQLSARCSSRPIPASARLRISL